MSVVYQISQLSAATDPDVADINRLLTQLSEKYPPRTAQTMRETVAASKVFVARSNEEKIIGMLVLAPLYKLSTTPIGMIHDVVVDQAYRGQGIGRALMEAAVAEARGMGLIHLEFTSSPARTEANRLYQKMGFRPRETNVYRIDL